MNTEPNTSFDSPWKDIVETYLPEFFAFFFPDAYTAIDWERSRASMSHNLPKESMFITIESLTNIDAESLVLSS